MRVSLNVIDLGLKEIQKSQPVNRTIEQEKSKLIRIFFQKKAIYRDG